MITGGAPAGDNGGGRATRIGATACTARSRNSEYNFRRAQNEKAISLARKSTIVSPEVINGNQTIICDVGVETPFIKLGKSTSGTTIADANDTPNHGMI